LGGAAGLAALLLFFWLFDPFLAGLPADPLAGGAFFGSFFSFPKEINGDLRPPKDKDGDGLYTALDYPIVTSGKTKEAFEKGEDEALQVFGN
jgi:hypothetical protein